MRSVGQIISERSLKKDIRNKFEFQAYGNRLAEELSDPKHRSLYIKYAKTLDRKILERAREFVRSISDPKKGSRAQLFMWKLKLLREESRNKD